MVEKCLERSANGFFCLADVQKAFDRVRRPVLYRVLEKLGAPPSVVAMVRAFHDGQMGCSGTGSIRFPVRRGVRQGCSVAPTLFVLYLAAALMRYRDKRERGGLSYHHDSRFRLSALRANMRGLTAERLLLILFADDVLLAERTAADLGAAFGELASSLAPFGLSLDAGKSHALACTPGQPSPSEIPTPVGNVAVSKTVTYLGSIVSADGTAKTDVEARAKRASQQLGALRRSWLSHRDVSRHTRATAVRSCVLSTLTFGLEGAALKSSDTHRLSVVWNRAVRFAYGIGLRGQAENHITDAMLRERLSLPSAADHLRQQRLRWAGHLVRHDTSATRLAFSCMKGSRRVGRPRLAWRHVLNRDIKSLQLPANTTWTGAAEDRIKWKAVIRQD
jgi:hypothetical protein